jgi:putative PEP-CTERM system histidine kinase
LLIALSVLVLVEQLYRNSPSEARWALKYMCLGIGGLYAFDLYLFAQSYLLSVIDLESWTARGVVNALLVPMLAISARRNPHWSVELFVSRHVVFYTTALIAIGLYLFLMSLGGYYIRLYGGSWGGLLEVVFLAGAVLVLASLMFSSQIRARLRVFLSKHFYRNRYDYRDEWLRFSDTLSAGKQDESVYETAVRSMAQIIQSPGGVIWTVERGGERWTPMGGWNAAIDHLCVHQEQDSLVEFLQERHWIVDLKEFDEHPERYGALELHSCIRDTDPRGLIVPLFKGDAVYGFVLLKRPAGLMSLNYEDHDLLKTVGKQLAVHVAQSEADRHLAEAQQFNAFNRLSAFIMHDLKNVMAQQSMLLANAERHKSKPEFVDDMISTIQNSVERMNRLMLQLQQGEPDARQVRVDLNECVRKALARVEGQHPTPRVDLLDETALLAGDPELVVAALEHLLRNAKDAAGSEGEVGVAVARTGASVTITIQDDGPGMSSAFIRERLFRPFDSTKGSKGMGIGAYQAREYVRMMGGDIEVASEQGSGAVFRVIMPLAEYGHSATEDGQAA